MIRPLLLAVALLTLATPVSAQCITPGCDEATAVVANARATGKALLTLSAPTATGTATPTIEPTATPQPTPTQIQVTPVPTDTPMPPTATPTPAAIEIASRTMTDNVRPIATALLCCVVVPGLLGLAVQSLGGRR